MNKKPKMNDKVRLHDGRTGWVVAVGKNKVAVMIKTQGLFEIIWREWKYLEEA